MAEHIVTNSQAAEKDPLVDRYSQILTENGYTVVGESVHGKNQTRFLHFVLEKDGKKYFSKANRFNVHDTHMNASLIKYIKNIPESVSFLAPEREIIEDDVVFHLYPYINQEPVSNESKEFSDFNVDEEDIDVFLERVLSAIKCVESQKGLVTNQERNRDKNSEDIALRLLRNNKPPNDTPYGVEFLKYLANERGLNEYRMAIDDIQAQNMFWYKEDKSLTVFDFDFVGPKLRYYDHAKFAASLWVVYDKPEYAKRFAKMVFDDVPEGDRGLAYRYMRRHLTEEALIDYGAFDDPTTQARTKEFMKWIRRDLLFVANN